MAQKPWYTSQNLIDAVKRKIAIPISQNTFTEEDILAFANEEMMISQVPDILQYHEEYFVFSEDIPLEIDKVRYGIPERAIGLKLRDVWYKDLNDNLFEMTRVNADDQSFFQREMGAGSYIQKYFLEGNDIVLSPIHINNVTGFLHVTYFLRPNQLVLDDRAAISTFFTKKITIDNTMIVAGDTVTIKLASSELIFTAVSGVPSALQFQIGINSVATATNLANAINLDSTYIANNGSPSTAIVTIKYEILATEFKTSNIAGFIISSEQGIEFSAIPSNITNGSKIDFLQTKPGHKSYKLSIKMGNTAITGDQIYFVDGIVPETFIIGDYISTEYESIIPQIPTDLHNGLAERVCARIMAAQGDAQGLQMSNAKIEEIKAKEGTLLDTRVDGSVPKVIQRKSLLSYMKMGIRRRL